MRKIFLASDHAGFELKDHINKHLNKKGYDVEDLGPYSYNKNDDYPDFIKPLAEKITEDKESFGIIFGGSGNGEAITANRVNGVRAIVYYYPDTRIIKLGRDHNDSNILSIGARFISKDDSIEAVDLFLSTPFSKNERHVRRIEKI